MPIIPCIFRPVGRAIRTDDFHGLHARAPSPYCWWGQDRHSHDNAICATGRIVGFTAGLGRLIPTESARRQTNATLGGDLLSDSLIGGLSHRPDQNDRAVIGYAKSVMGVFDGG